MSCSYFATKNSESLPENIAGVKAIVRLARSGGSVIDSCTLCGPNFQSPFVWTMGCR